VSQKRVLYIDLSRKKSEIKIHSDLETVLGGVGLGTALYNDLAETSPIILSIGPFAALLPGCSSTCATFRSPLTAGQAESYAGGWLAACMRFSHLDAIVINGRSPAPVYLVITDGDVKFKDASPIVGRNVFESFRYLSETEGFVGKRSIVTIGKGGENRVAYASVNVDNYHEFSRLGLGSVFGRAGLKGFVISATESIEVKNDALFSSLRQEIITTLREGTSKNIFPGFNKFGNVAGIKFQNDIGGMPVRNLSSNRFGEIGNISEESWFSAHKPHGIASVGNPVPEKFIFDLQDMKIPLGYDSIVSLGPLIGLSNRDSIISLRALALDYGLDPVSLGFVLSYIHELEGLTFSEDFSLRKLVTELVDQSEKWSKQLSGGVQASSVKMGGVDFALALNGLEMAPYFNGYATIVGQLAGLSQNLEDTEGHRLDIGLLGRDFDNFSLAGALIQREKLILLLNSLSVDYFARGLYADISLVFSLLQSLGYSWSKEELERFTEELYYLKLGAKKRSGFSQDRWQVPEKIFKTPSAYGLLKENRLNEILNVYKSEYWT
jgi:aldehyde:ferredoxin oxidoreductase